ncbi:BSD domain-containing protein 1 [Mactra antiquata]
MYEMVGNDLAEFTNTMQSDTKKVVEKTKETLQTTAENKENKNATDMMKQSFHSLMHGITKALTVDPEDTTPKQSVTNPTHGIFDRAKARLRAIQVDTGTYVNEPSGSLELYADWLKSFDLENHKGDISELLVTMVEVRSLYTSLVPSEVSHQDFWRRYFYKVHQLDVDEARKQALMKRAERANTREDSIGWDEEEEWSGDDDGSPGKKSMSPDSIKREDPNTRLQAVTETTTTGDAMPANTDNKLETSKTVEQKSDSQNNVNADTEAKHSDGPKEKNKPPGNSDSSDVQKSDKDIVQNKGKSDINDSVTDEKQTVNIDEADIEIDSVNTLAEVNISDKKEEGPVVKELKSETTSDQSSNIKENKDNSKDEKELKTKLKGDMVVVGDRISPSTDSTGTKESEDWEQDFDVDITAEDMVAASQLAQKMNLSASEYNQLTGGEEDDWENWE